MALGRYLGWRCKQSGGKELLQEVYKQLGYPKKTGWKYSLMFFTTIIIPLTILIGIGIVLSIPALIKEKVFD